MLIFSVFMFINIVSDIMDDKIHTFRFVENQQLIANVIVISLNPV